MFITIDGPDGVGKTTVAKKLTGMLHHAKYTREPTDTGLGQEIRRILSCGTDEEKATLTDLFVADRQCHIDEFILPNTRDGYDVVCDRYKYSTICYQHIQGRPLEELLQKNAGFLAPDIAFILNVRDSALLLEHIGQRGEARDFFETPAYLDRIIRIYDELPRYFPQENIVRVDANDSVDNVTGTMLEIIRRHRAKTKTLLNV